MIDKADPARPAQAMPGKRKRRWWRLILAAAAALVVLAVAGVALFVKLQPTAPPLTLPTARAVAPAGPLDGTWRTAPGSEAGFRVRESALGFGNDVVGRTGEVSGTAVIADGRVARAAFRVDLTTITVGGKTRSAFATSLGTRANPAATVVLGAPLTPGPAFSAGATVTRTAAAVLTMHGVARPVTVTVSARRDGTALELAGSIPVQFAGWGIRTPGGAGFLGSLADHGIAEFRLVLRRA